MLRYNLNNQHILIGDTVSFLKDEDLACKNAKSSFEDYKTVYFDAKRTRVLQSKKYPSFKSDLKNILLYYCIQNNISYKQGLNEILAPFLILHFQYPHLLTKVEVYQMFKEFVNIYIINFIIEKQFQSFRHSLQLFQILLRYHNPILHSFFGKMSVIPEMYALSWLLTVFSSKLRFDIVFKLWAYFIRIKDPLFPYYLLIALFIEKTDELIQQDNIKVISLLCSITIDSEDQLNLLITKANQIKEETPYSFKLMIDSINMFNINREFHSKEKEIENLPLMPILAYELCHLARPDIFKCPNAYCSNITKYNNLTSITNKKEGDCWICNDKIKNDKKDIYDSYIILDIRESNHLDSCGLITKSIFIKEDLLNDKDNSNVSICQMLQNEKGNYRFIILLSKTSYIDSYEKERYEKDRLSSITSRKVTILGRQKINRLNPLFISHSKKQREYDKFKKLINLLTTKNDFPYVSYCYGGFEEIHKLFLQYNIPIVLHTYSQCLLCNKSHKKMKLGKSFSLQKNRFHLNNYAFGGHQYLTLNGNAQSTIVTLNDISDIISSNKSQVYFGILIESENNKNSKNSQLFICLNEKECIIYKKAIEIKNCDSFTLLNTFPINKIVLAKRDLTAKNILRLIIDKDGLVINNNQNIEKDTFSLLIDFTNKEECRRFLVDLKEYSK